MVIHNKSMNEISNNESDKHEHISYPLIHRLAIICHRRRCHCLTVGELHEPGEEEGNQEQTAAQSHRTHFPNNNKFLQEKRGGRKNYENWCVRSFSLRLRK